MCSEKDYCLSKEVNIPIELYQSYIGNYFVGYADELGLCDGNAFWAMLYNPHDSGVNLYVNVWTVTVMSVSPYNAQFWFNACPFGDPEESEHVTPSNTALCPAPLSKIKILSSTNVCRLPEGGAEAFIRLGQPGNTLVESENGKLIFPPGGNFLVYITLTDKNKSADGRVAFGWWEEEIRE